jgi:DNA-directed RNA polymerase specialized sigma24 family protein
MPKRSNSIPEPQDDREKELLQRLPEAERLVLVLLRLGFTREDVAEQAGLSLQQLDEVVARAMAKIKA